MLRIETSYFYLSANHINRKLEFIY